MGYVDVLSVRGSASLSSAHTNGLCIVKDHAATRQGCTRRARKSPSIYDKGRRIIRDGMAEIRLNYKLFLNNRNSESSEFR